MTVCPRRAASRAVRIVLQAPRAHRRRSIVVGPGRALLVSAKGVYQAESLRVRRKGISPLLSRIPVDSATGHLRNGFAWEAHARDAGAKSPRAILRREVHAAKAALEVRAGAVEGWALGECGRRRARWAILNVTAAGRSEQ